MSQDTAAVSTANTPKLASAVLAGGEISDYYAFHRTEDAQQVTIIALTVDLSQDMMPAGKNLTIFSDVVNLVSPGGNRPKLSLPGKTLRIIARKIVMNGVTLDVSGAPPVNRYDRATSRGKDGDPGKEGAPGAPGARGKDSGDITLVAEEFVGDVSVGCAGGGGELGQNGGNGGSGVAGANGPDAVIGGPAGMDDIVRGPEDGKKEAPAAAAARPAFRATAATEVALPCVTSNRSSRQALTMRPAFRAIGRDGSPAVRRFRAAEGTVAPAVWAGAMHPAEP